MEDTFKLEIISPEKIIFSDNARVVTIPSYEGEMSVLKNHIPLIAFLRPGIITVSKKGENMDKFFVEDGTVEYFKDNLVVLSVSAVNVKDITKELINNLNKDVETKLSKKELSDHERYILNHKLNTLKEIRA